MVTWGSEASNYWNSSGKAPSHGNMRPGPFFADPKFVAGIYGMNLRYMPELKITNGLMEGGELGCDRDCG